MRFPIRLLSAISGSSILSSAGLILAPEAPLVLPAVVNSSNSYASVGERRHAIREYEEL